MRSYRPHVATSRESARPPTRTCAYGRNAAPLLRAGGTERWRWQPRHLLLPHGALNLNSGGGCRAFAAAGGGPISNAATTPGQQRNGHVWNRELSTLFTDQTLGADRKSTRLNSSH